MRERLQNSRIFQGLAVVLGAYPTVFLLGSHFVEDVWFISPLTAGFYGSILLILLMRWKVRELSMERLGVYTLLVIVNGLYIGGMLLIEWWYSWQAMVQMIIRIVLPYGLGDGLAAQILEWFPYEVFPTHYTL